MKVLLIDDDQMALMILSNALRNKGFEVSRTNSAEEGLALLNSSKDLSIVVSDWMMPEMDGITFCKKVRACSERYIYFIMLTSRSDHADMLAGYEAGVDEFMIKPPDYDVLERRIRVAMRIVGLEQKLRQEMEKTDGYARDMEKLANERAKQLVVADRMATLGTMSAGVAHEINNPTTFISGNAQTFESFWPFISEVIHEKLTITPDDSRLEFILTEVPDLIDGIKNGTRRISKIVNSLKSFAHQSPGEEDQFNSFALPETIENALLLCRNRLKYNIRVDKHLDEPLPLIFGDSLKIEQVLVNLINNATDAMEKKEKGLIEIRAWPDRTGVHLTIADNGSGIPPGILDQIFDPFFTTKSVGKGTGLGMSISHGIIKQHNGSLTAQNRDNGGALFQIWLPLNPKNITENRNLTTDAQS